MPERRLDLWLPSYVIGAPSRLLARRAAARRLTHVFFLICDHFEPRHDASNDKQAFDRVATWRREYPAFQRRCRESFGHAPLHTWFYPPHHGAEHLPALADMAHEGGGEVELHYHHSDDTAKTLTRDLERTIALYQRHGLLFESGVPPRTAFGFVHGDWTLDNACDGVRCGVNGELSILRGLGCWGDFTMPSGNAAQTRKINSIYYATDDPSRCKSHDRGVDARVGAAAPRGFFLMQGPLAINWRAPRYPRIENASLTTSNWGRPDRIAAWLDCRIHVRGRPDWLFVKLHTHGAIEHDFDALFGDRAWRMHQALQETCNDGRRYRLHYVTARQAYNLVKAAESGCDGDPDACLDHAIGPPATAWYSLDVGHRLLACAADRLRIDEVDCQASTRLKSRTGLLRAVDGAFTAIDVDARSGRIEIAATKGAPLKLTFTAPVDLLCEGDDRTLRQSADAADVWHVLPSEARTLAMRCQARAVA
jgi:hypothetical protein